MASNYSLAISNAAKLDEIGFPEFTTKLIVDIFEALLKSNTQQIDTYIKMVEALSANLTDYINETKDEIGSDEIIEFLKLLGSNLASIEDVIGNPDTAPVTLPLSTLTQINDMPSQANPAPPTLSATSTNAELRDAIASRIAESKYSLLTQMTKIGLLRTVVTDGTIRTKLMFNTYDFSSYVNNTVKNEVENKGLNGNIGGKYSRLLSPSSFALSGGIGGSNTKLAVKTVNETVARNAGTNIDIYGEVVINFKTDYLPLSQ